MEIKFSCHSNTPVNKFKIDLIVWKLRIKGIWVKKELLSLKQT